MAVNAINEAPDLVMPYLMTAGKFPTVGEPMPMAMAGWDSAEMSMTGALARHGVLEKGIWAPYGRAVDDTPVKAAPDPNSRLRDQVAKIKEDMRQFLSAFPDRTPVLVNLLPSGVSHDLSKFSTVEELYAHTEVSPLADIAYVLAAVETGVPVANFTPNEIEIPAVVDAAQKAGIPLAGRDGKTGQTYLKVVLASAFRARQLQVNGWYSVNILGNADGENLMDPGHAACKLDNKTDVLENVLGYAPGMSRYGKSAHKVCIDYYPPRGDAKEAWDVIDFESVFGLPMSLRLNLQGRDSILAVPMVIDLARWMAVLHRTGFSGLVPDLAFYFKKGLGRDAPVGFQEQLKCVEGLEAICRERLAEI
ncbi:MAG: inositol-3-phosphate synthase [Thermodesulfobacteriota bacterium]